MMQRLELTSVAVTFDWDMEVCSDEFAACGVIGPAALLLS